MHKSIYYASKELTRINEYSIFKPEMDTEAVNDGKSSR